MEAILIALIGGLFASGGITTWVKARNDYRLKKAKSEFDNDSSLMTRQDKLILNLTLENAAHERYIIQLQNALVKAGVEIPDRKE